MSLLAALAKGLGAGTLQNAKDGFDEQTRQKEEIRRQAEIREQISATKDEGIREWKKRDEQLNKQLTASKDELNARMKFEHEEAEKQRAHDLAKYEASLKATLTEATTKGTYEAEKSATNNLIGAVKFIETSKQKIMDSDTITPEQKKEKMAQWDLIGAMTTQTPYAQDLLRKHGGGAYVDLYASMMPSQNQPQQGGEPTSGANPQPTSAPSRPGGSGGGAGEDNGQAFTGSYGGSRAADPPIPTQAEAFRNYTPKIGASGYPTDIPQFRGPTLMQRIDAIDREIGHIKPNITGSGLINRLKNEGKYGYAGYGY